MQYEFLKNFPKRMKNVGLYGVLIQNSIQKTSWKQFGFLKFDEQMNLIFAVMLYIMEQSLREDHHLPVVEKGKKEMILKNFKKNYRNHSVCHGNTCRKCLGTETFEFMTKTIKKAIVKKYDCFFAYFCI